jgi:hypothetical protein
MENRDRCDAKKRERNTRSITAGRLLGVLSTDYSDELPKEGN